jgi:hypothetical protein
MCYADCARSETEVQLNASRNKIPDISEWKCLSVDMISKSQEEAKQSQARSPPTAESGPDSAVLRWIRQVVDVMALMLHSLETCLQFVLGRPCMLRDGKERGREQNADSFQVGFSCNFSNFSQPYFRCFPIM